MWYNIRRRFNPLRLKNIGKRQNITKSDLNKAIQLHNESLSDLQKRAKLGRIKNSDNLSKEDLIYTLLGTKKIFSKIITQNTLTIYKRPNKSKNKQNQNNSCQIRSYINKRRKKFYQRKAVQIRK